MEIWDAGTYEAEKFEPDKVVLEFFGEKVSGRYALFQTRGDDWMIHRMDPPEPGREPLPVAVEPMRAKPGRMPSDDEKWAFEVLWEGVRALALCEPGHMRLLNGGEDLVGTYPEVRGVLEQLHAREALLDGVIVAFGDDGVPDPKRIERRAAADTDSKIRRLRRDVPVTYVVFDLLHLDGRTLLDAPYEDRRAELEALELQGPAWQVPAYHRGDGKAFRAVSAERGLPGVVAKRLGSRYAPGKENRDWRAIKAGP
jgi:bifunctional non-homologous end joining protein LigD